MSEKFTLNLGEYQVDTIVTGGAWQENCYLVSHLPSSEQILIDPGDDPDIIIQTVVKNKAMLRYILLTHAHFDHVGAVAALCRHFNISCYVHKDDARLLRHAPIYAMRFAGKQIEVPAKFQIYENRPMFQLGQRQIDVIPTVGHTAGSVSYCFDTFVFTGDTLLYKHVGRTDMPGSDSTLLAASVTRLLEQLPGDTVVFAGHGRSWTIGEAQEWWQNVTDSPPEYNDFYL